MTLVGLLGAVAGMASLAALVVVAIRWSEHGSAVVACRRSLDAVIEAERLYAGAHGRHPGTLGEVVEAGFLELEGGTLDGADTASPRLIGAGGTWWISFAMNGQESLQVVDISPTDCM